MAEFSKRTIDSIFQSLLTEKNTFSSLTGLTTTTTDLSTLLSELNSDSKVSTWRLLQYIESTGIWSLENLMEIFINDIETEKATASIGSKLWYVEQALAFQYGDILQINPSTYRPYYTTVDTSKQIVGSCSAQEAGGKLILKIRGKNSDILTSDELNALYSYIAQIKFAGVRVQVRNSVADDLKLYFTILYDPQRPVADIQTDVESVINDYIANIEFDSSFKTNALIDKLQVIKGVSDVQWNNLYVMNHPNNTYTSFTWSTTSYAGYFAIDGSYPLSDTITYTPII